MLFPKLTFLPFLLITNVQHYTISFRFEAPTNCNKVLRHVNSQYTFMSVDSDDFISGQTIFCNLETEIQIEDLYVLGKSNSLNVTVIDNLDGSFSSSIVTPCVAGDYFVTFDSISCPSSGYGLASIFVYSDGIHDCVSSASLEEARARYYKNHLASSDDLVLLGIEEAPENFAPNTTRYVAETSFASFTYSGNDIVASSITHSLNLGNKIRVKGTINWYDENNISHPLRKSYIELFDNDIIYNEFCTGGYTDEAGSFSFLIDEQTLFEIGGRDLFIKMAPKNDSTHVFSFHNHYSFVTPLLSDVAANTEVEYIIEIHPGVSDRANAFEISQSQIIPHDYIYAISGTDLPVINIVYPSVTQDTCYYFGVLVNYIAVSELFYKEWDILNHEYGHYICDFFSLCDMSVWGRHTRDEDLIESNGFVRGAKFAMSEGLATYLGVASQMYFGTSSNIPTVGDDKYTDIFNDFEDDYGSWRYGNSDCTNFGEGNESSIPSLLIKLLDNAQREGDNVSLGHQAMWDIISESEHSNISSLVVDIISNYPNLTDDIGLILEQEKFSATLSSMSTVFSTDPNNSCWSFSWYNSTTASGRSNLFNLVFRGNGSSYQINNIYGNYKSLSNTQINTVLALPGNSVDCYVVGYLDGYPSIGGYVSSFKTISKPSCASISINSPYSASMYYGENEWYKFTASEAATYHFESSGWVDTFGEVFSSVVVDDFTDGRLAYDDNSGSNNNFKVSIALSANQTVYLRVTGASPIDQGNYSVNVTLTHSTHNYHYSYVQYSSLQHKAYCSCGLYTLEAHAADYSRSYNLQGHHYAPCLYCGTVLELGGGGNNPFIPLPGSTNQMVTDNGSYIMPNGIYVIMEEDLEAFINGTLVFHPIGDELY